MKCRDCGSARTAVSVHGIGEFCLPCHNRWAAERMGVRFDHTPLEPFDLVDGRGVTHRFQVESYLGPTGHVLTARERVRPDEEGWEFKVLGDAEADILQLLARLYEQARDALATPCLDESLFPKAALIRGRITCDLDGAGTPLLVIDGRSFTWEEFGAFFASHEGFEFEVRFEDAIKVVGGPLAEPRSDR